MMRIFYIDWQQHWKYDRTITIGANAHGKRAVSTLKIATGDRLDLRWQLGFQWHGIGIEIVLQVPRRFHNATVSQCDHFLLLHMYMYLLFETSPGWRGFFKLNLVGATQLQCIYYLCPILISRPPRVFRRFKRRSCVDLSSVKSSDMHLRISQKIPEPPMTQISMKSNKSTQKYWCFYCLGFCIIMMMSWHGNAFCVTGFLWWENTSHWGIPLTKGQ